MLHLRRPGTVVGLVGEDLFELGVSDGDGRNLGIDPPGGDVGVDQGLDLLRNAEQVQGRITVEVGRHLVDEPQQLGIPKTITWDLGAMLQQVQGLVKLAQCIDEVGTHPQVSQ